MAETHSRERETSVPAGAPCPVCATPNDVPQKNARFQCKECGLFSILGPDGVFLEVESETVEALPDKLPELAKCSECRYWFVIDPKDSKCMWCRGKFRGRDKTLKTVPKSTETGVLAGPLTPPVKPRVSRRKTRGIILYLLLTVLVALVVCCSWSGQYTITFNLLLFVEVVLVACFLSLDPYIYKGK
jgi:hypothetical protein